MATENVDYLILGQGLAGTLLSRELLKAGKKIRVIDDQAHLSASRACGGVINPVTGKRLVSSWLIDQLLPFALDYYREAERAYNMPLITECDILDFHASMDAKSAFEDRATTGGKYLHRDAEEEKWSEYFRFQYGIGSISPCLALNAPALIDMWRLQLAERGLLMSEKFEWNDCKYGAGIEYRGITAQKIICCEGAAGEHNPYFGMLPWSRDKGEALIAEIPGLPRTHIYKQGISIVPHANNTFWIGATHDWKYTDLGITAAFRQNVETQLGYWLKLPYRITDHIVALRPANMERKPFAGTHPLYPQVAILNGMGGKGCSLAPWCATALAAHLVSGATLPAEIDVARHRRILAR